MVLKSLNPACKGHLLTLQFLNTVDIQSNRSIDIETCCILIHSIRYYRKRFSGGLVVCELLSTQFLNPARMNRLAHKSNTCSHSEQH